MFVVVVFFVLMVILYFCWLDCRVFVMGEYDEIRLKIDYCISSFVIFAFFLLLFFFTDNLVEFVSVSFLFHLFFWVFFFCS